MSAITGLRILVAEDEALVALGLIEMLKNGGHQVVGHARNGAEAVDLAGTVDPELVFVDIRMPGLDGLEAARRILQKQQLPIIVLTAFTDAKLIDEADAAGVAAYLTKPVTEKALMPAIALAISRFQELATLRQEVNNLQEALESRKLVERAKGVLMDKRQMSEADAFRLLQKESSKRNLKLAELSRVIIEASDLL